MRVAPQIMDIAPVIAPLVTVGLVAVGLVDIARLVALAGQTIVLVQQIPELLAATALAEVLAEVVVALDCMMPHCMSSSTQHFKVGTAEVLALRGCARAALAGLVASTIPLLVVWAQADRLERLGHFLTQGLMAAEPVVETLDTPGALRTPRPLMDQFKLLDTSRMAALAQFVSCGAVVDPILLMQRTYNR